jgi:hypothetical protein
MPGAASDLLHGTFDVLILKALALQELHGMGISRRIAQMTSDAFEVKAGSLFPALPTAWNRRVGSPPVGESQRLIGARSSIH